MNTLTSLAFNPRSFPEIFLVCFLFCKKASRNFRFPNLHIMVVSCLSPTRWQAWISVSSYFIPSFSPSLITRDSVFSSSSLWMPLILMQSRLPYCSRSLTSSWILLISACSFPTCFLSSSFSVSNFVLLLRMYLLFFFDFHIVY